MAIITILSASANAIIAGFLYQESITDYSEFSYGEMFKQAGLAFLGGLIVGGLSILATFLVFALALTALECMLCMMICGVLGILTDSISDTFFSDNEIVNQILKYVSQGLYGAGLTFGLAGIAGGGITYGGADDAAGYSPKGASKTADDLIQGVNETTNGKGIARNFEKTGGYSQTVNDFNSLNPTNVKEIQTKYGTGYVGTLSDGTTVVARPGSATGGATLEINISNSKVYKIRY